MPDTGLLSIVAVMLTLIGIGTYIVYIYNDIRYDICNITTVILCVILCM